MICAGWHVIARSRLVSGAEENCKPDKEEPAAPAAADPVDLWGRFDPPTLPRRACEAQSILSRDGLIIAGREGGVRPHPAVAIRRDAEISFARLLRELDLDTEPASGLRTAPPSLRSNRRGL
jgi:hypothetical protein